MKNLYTDPQKCRKICAETAKCFSVNIYQNKNDKMVCELVKGSRDGINNKDCVKVGLTGKENHEFEVQL